MVSEPQSELDRRHVAVDDLVAALGALALLATDHATVAWLLGRQADPGTWVLATPEQHVDFHGADQVEACAALVQLLDRTGHIPFAVEASSLPAAALKVLAGHPLVDAAGPLASLRLVHSEFEIAQVKAACELASFAQDTLRGYLEAGMSEQETYECLDGELRKQGFGVTAVVDLMFGERCSRIGLPPSSRRLAPGETVLFDFAPLLDGFWGDSCTTSVLGSAPNAVRRAHDWARRALDAGIAAARTGRTVGAVDRVVRDVIREGGYPDYPHITGHGIGHKQQDLPLLDPGSEVVLRPGMVIALEPGIYQDDFGLRVEHVMLITDGDAKLLTSHDLALSL